MSLPRPDNKMYKIKGWRPRTDPCGTPNLRCTGSNHGWWKAVHGLQICRHKMTYMRAVPHIPTCCRMLMRIWWFPVSNAADRSRKSNTVWFWSAIWLIIDRWRWLVLNVLCKASCSCFTYTRYSFLKHFGDEVQFGHRLVNSNKAVTAWINR